MIDSGLGGLYYLRSLVDNNSYVLIMDSAYFPYGSKSKEFLLKRTLFLCSYLVNKTEQIIFACNTLSLIVLPFIKLFYKNVRGVFEELAPYINDNSAILASSRSCKEIKKIYPNNLIINGSELINKIEMKSDFTNEVMYINNLIKNSSNLILACTHFLVLDDVFVVETIKNNYLQNKS
ncbi:MAG: hypothetical protein ACI35S_10065 [Anaeroplasma sp.]